MRNILKSALVVGLAACSLASSNTLANAQDLELRVGPGGVGVYDRNQDREYGHNRYGRGGCDPDEALDAARDAGFRRAHIVRASARNIVVEGFTRGGPDRIVFANVRGCPEI
ncbi:hypothetical protein ASC97_11410 [Rhizobium sp. Root1203]|uniref:hypothetical protein n=1 Tax=Rhizobium sp. Root1203 TaxID=1736427 RepID=UPI00070AC51E|nr:hypothetical protein [Rhizobium sp. Root1203]KQV16370.1 hypothetical protein ASC97_11410 [Rhizobium sp. Root1203]